MTIASLGAIETQSPLALPELARRLEALGYERLWATEHHSPQQSASPAIAAAIAAAVTRQIKVGTAGVMLRYQSPLRTAQDFHLLGALYPGRIECGLNRSQVTDSLV